MMNASLQCPSYSRPSHLSLAFMKRRSGGASTQTTRLVSQKSSVDSAVTLFKLEDSDADGSSEQGPSAVRRSKKKKRVKIEAVKDEEIDNNEGESPVLANTGAPAGKGKKRERLPSSRSRQTPSGASPQKPTKAIKQALEKPHPAPARWRETYDAIKEMRSRFPAPVDTMGCDTAKWKETDPRVRQMHPQFPSFSSNTRGPAFFFFLN